MTIRNADFLIGFAPRVSADLTLEEPHLVEVDAEGDVEVILL